MAGMRRKTRFFSQPHFSFLSLNYTALSIFFCFLGMHSPVTQIFWGHLHLIRKRNVCPMGWRGRKVSIFHPFLILIDELKDASILKDSCKSSFILNTNVVTVRFSCRNNTTLNYFHWRLYLTSINILFFEFPSHKTLLRLHMAIKCLQD